MKLNKAIILSVLACAMISGSAIAQSDPPATRAQIKMDRDEFLKTHHYDPEKDAWMLNGGVQPPAGVMSRSEIKAARDQFLKTNTYDSQKNAWMPITPGTDAGDKKTRAQVRMERAQFLKDHKFDPTKNAWGQVGN